MNKKHVGIIMLLAGLLFFSGCGYRIKYAMEEPDVVRADEPIPLKVAMVPLKDVRPEIEKDIRARKAEGYPDAGDYTYDSQFADSISAQLTDIGIQHLNFSGVFSQNIQKLLLSDDVLTDARLDEIGANGYDAVLTGSIRHYSGYYDNNIGRTLLYSVPLAVASGSLLSWKDDNGVTQTTYYWYGPGLVLGEYLESLHKRKIEKKVEITLRLVDTGNHRVLWEESVDASSSEQKAMPGLAGGSNRFKITTNAVRQVMNQMVRSLGNNREAILSVSADTGSSEYTPMTDAVEYVDAKPIEVTEAPTAPEHASAPGTGFGIKAGWNYSSYSIEDTGDPTFIHGFHAGGVFENRFNARWRLQAELIYSTKGYDVDDEIQLTPFYEGESFSMHYEMRARYIDVPVMAGYQISDGFSLLTGFSMNFFLSGNYSFNTVIPSITFDPVTFRTKVTEETIEMSEDIEKSDVNTVNMSWVAGLEYRFSDFTMGARYCHDLSSMSKNFDEFARVIQVYGLFRL